MEQQLNRLWPHIQHYKDSRKRGGTTCACWFLLHSLVAIPAPMQDNPPSVQHGDPFISMNHSPSAYSEKVFGFRVTHALLGP